MRPPACKITGHLHGRGPAPSLSGCVHIAYAAFHLEQLTTFRGTHSTETHRRCLVGLTSTIKPNEEASILLWFDVAIQDPLTPRMSANPLGVRLRRGTTVEAPCYRVIRTVIPARPPREGASRQSGQKFLEGPARPVRRSPPLGEGRPVGDPDSRSSTLGSSRCRQRRAASFEPRALSLPASLLGGCDRRPTAEGFMSSRWLGTPTRWSPR